MNSILNQTEKYIVFVDGDDWWHENYLKSMRELISSSMGSVDCVLGRMTEHCEENNEQKIIGV